MSETLAADAKASLINDYYMQFYPFKASQGCYLLYICLIYNSNAEAVNSLSSANCTLLNIQQFNNEKCFFLSR